MRKHLLLLIVTFALLAVNSLPPRATVKGDGGSIYLPMIYNRYNPLAALQVVNAPYLPVTDVTGTKYSEMAILWFGNLRNDSNYTDARVAYNDQALWVSTSTFDRRLWYNPASNGSGLKNWDSATLLLHLNGTDLAIKPTTRSYQFVAEMRWYEGSQGFQAAYTGDGNQWVQQPIAFTGSYGWRGNAPNDDIDDMGWTMTFKIPFASLGLSGRPADGAVWRMSIIINDRDSRSGPMSPVQSWPGESSPDNPGSWATLHFGQPVYNPPQVTNTQTTMIRQGLNGAIVPDASVGGGTICGYGLNLWSQWGEANYAGQEYFNIQNQSDVADWPCFSKYYVTFPIGTIPSGKAILSARLVLHEWGGADPAHASPSLIQVLQASQDWSEGTLNWNNAPLPLENIAQTWVQVYGRPIQWPGDPYEWDVSRAFVRAYAQGQALKLVLYSADSAQNSGKYFVSSNTGDWNAEGRPTLIVKWGDPQ